MTKTAALLFVAAGTSVWLSIVYSTVMQPDPNEGQLIFRWIRAVISTVLVCIGTHYLFIHRRR